MKRVSLFDQGTYAPGWIRDFYSQAAIWWGDDPNEPGVHDARLAIVQRLAGLPPKRMLDLGAGAFATAGVMADAGYDVTGIELSTARCELARKVATAPHKGKITLVEGNFLKADVGGDYDVICAWEVFGLGSDAEQRQMLKRMSSEWLAPGGLAIVEVYTPVTPMRNAGSEVHLEALEGVPGSVDMIERCHFDPVYSRWIDEWVPEKDPGNALAQAIRCYTPADLLLLLEGTGMQLERIEAGGEEIDFRSGRVTTGGPLMGKENNYNYLTVLKAAA